MSKENPVVLLLEELADGKINPRSLSSAFAALSDRLDAVDGGPADDTEPDAASGEQAAPAAGKAKK